MNILAPFIAGLALANAAHHWHDQLKPFNTGEEANQALKEILAENPFTSLWSEENKKQLVGNPDFLSFTDGPNGYNLGKNFSQLFLGIPENSPIRVAVNRHDLKKVCDGIAATLGHEGAHAVQSDAESAIACGFGVNPQGLANGVNNLLNNKPNVDLPQFHLSESLNMEEYKKYNKPGENKYLIVKNFPPTYMSENKKFMALVGSFHQKIEDYENNRSRYEKKQTSSEHSQLQETLASQLESISYTLAQISQEVESDADKQGLEATISSYNLTGNQKLKALINVKNHYTAFCTKEHKKDNAKSLCDEYMLSHPPCAERIALIDTYIPHARMEIINDTIRDEIAWQ